MYFKKLKIIKYSGYNTYIECSQLVYQIWMSYWKKKSAVKDQEDVRLTGDISPEIIFIEYKTVRFIKQKLNKTLPKLPFIRYILLIVINYEINLKPLVFSKFLWSFSLKYKKQAYFMAIGKKTNQTRDEILFLILLVLLEQWIIC